MKRLIATLLTIATFVALNVTALAAGFWKVTISSPANTTNKTFNVQYTTSSTDPADDFTVELYQNNSLFASQTTTTPQGDSGAFPVTVPSNGTYSYFIKATNSNAAGSRNTGTVTVTVSDPPAGTTTTVLVNNGTTNTATTAQGGQGGAGGAVAQAGGGAAGGAGGAAQGGQATPAAPGQVGAGAPAANTTTPNENGSVLGSEPKQDTVATTTGTPKENSTNPIWYLLGLGALAAVVYGAYIVQARAANKG